MTHVATLIAPTAQLAAPQLARAAAVLPRAAGPVWLAPETAADIPFAPPPGTDNARWAEAARATLYGAPVDVVVQPATGRRKHLLMSDMDSTVIEQECIDELAEGVGLRAEISAITARSMRGEVVFEQSLVERVALLKGLDLDRAVRLVLDRVTFTPGARTLVKTMRAHGALTVLASGGFTVFTDPIARSLEFDRSYGNTLEIAEGRLTGAVVAPIFGRDAKRLTLRALREELGLAPDDTLATGDGANDLAMLVEAGLGVAFRAKPAVAAVARAKVEHGDLTALLYIQGYARTEFVT
jgi:phosphoserine phosphatase